MPCSICVFKHLCLKGFLICASTAMCGMACILNIESLNFEVKVSYMIMSCEISFITLKFK